MDGKRFLDVLRTVMGRRLNPIGNGQAKTGIWDKTICAVPQSRYPVANRPGATTLTIVTSS